MTALNTDILHKPDSVLSTYISAATETPILVCQFSGQVIISEIEPFFVFHSLSVSSYPVKLTPRTNPFAEAPPEKETGSVSDIRYTAQLFDDEGS